MLRLFRNQNPYTVILLFVIALLLKMPILSDMPLPKAEEHQVFWNLILKKMFQIFGTNTYFYSFLSVICISLQALYLNYIVNNFHFYNKRSYLPAYTYILISSFIPQWSSLSIELLNNFLFLGLLNYVFHTYSDVNTRKVLFNAGLLFGFLFLFNFPNAWFLFFVAFSISILRAYKPAEWMVTILGIITPLYLFWGLAYLTDSLYLFSKMFSTKFSLRFALPQKEIYILGILLIYTILGLIVLSKSMSRMLFQIKKMWMVNIIFLIFSLICTIGLYQQGAPIWMVALIPASMFICKLWNLTKPKWLPELLNFILIASIVYFNWFMKM